MTKSLLVTLEIELQVLDERAADGLNDIAFDLVLESVRIDDLTAIMYHIKTRDMNGSRCGLDLNLGDVGPYQLIFDIAAIMSELLPKVYLARHGETEWTVTGRHTGWTDLRLTERGEDRARGLRERLRGLVFDRVFVSPLQRARRTCELAGFGDRAMTIADLSEWDYGGYEGRRTDEIHCERPGWRLFRDGCPGGESVAEVSARADRVIGRLRALPGQVLLFGHGHFLRVLAARWLDLPAAAGRYFVFGTTALSVLGYEHRLDDPAILLWNDDRHAPP